MLSSGDSSNNTIVVNGHCGDPERRKSKSRAALYSDDLRIQIIESIYQKRHLWTNDDRGASPATATDRKKTFAEIATRLQHHNSALNADDVERQWKNLKDTYVKVRKKIHSAGAAGTPAQQPRWRFYRLLQFIDPDERVVAAFDWERELAELKRDQAREAQQQQKSQQPQDPSKSAASFSASSTASSSNSSAALLQNPANTSTSVALQQHEPSSMLSHFSSPQQNTSGGSLVYHIEKPTPQQHPPQIIVHQMSAAAPPVPKNGRNMAPPQQQMIPGTKMQPPPPSQQPQFAGHKRSRDGQIMMQPPQNGGGQMRTTITVPITTAAADGSMKAPETNGVLTPIIEDEYVIFCNSLIHPLREIGQHNKMEYLKFKKVIHDALFDVQSRIHSMTPQINGVKNEPSPATSSGGGTTNFR